MPVTSFRSTSTVMAPRRRRRRFQGVAGNARLTGTLGAVLFVLLAAEGITILKIGPLLKWHVFVGMLLVPPVALKIGSTFYRFSKYYLQDPAYREKGPPLPLLRLLGPFLVVLTAILLGSGIGALYVTGGTRGMLLTLHKASFVLWFGAMAIHVLGHFAETARLAPRDLSIRTRHKVMGARARLAAIAVTLIAGVILGAALMGSASGFFLPLTTRH